MPFTLTYTGADGGSHPESYWTPVLFMIDTASSVCRVVYHGYHDFATWAAGTPPIPILGAVKAFDVVGSAFLAMMAAHMAPDGPHIGTMADDLAAADPFFGEATRVGFPGE